MHKQLHNLSNPNQPWGKETPLSFEPKSSNGHLATFCVHCNQRIECHNSYWVLNVGTLRVCDPNQVTIARRGKGTDEAFRATLKAQEIDNCRPTKTVANMDRHDPAYFPSDEVSAARHHVTKVLQPIITPFGTEDNCTDAAQTEVRRSRRAVVSQAPIQIVGAGAITMDASGQYQTNRHARR